MNRQFSIQRMLIGLTIAAPGFAGIGWIAKSGQRGVFLDARGAILASIFSTAFLGCGFAYPFGRPWLGLVLGPIVILLFVLFLRLSGME